MTEILTDEARLRVLQVAHRDVPPFLDLCRAHAAALRRLGACVTTLFLAAPAGVPADDVLYLGLTRVGRESARAVRELASRFPRARFELAVTHRYAPYRAVARARRRIGLGRFVAIAHEHGFLGRLGRRVEHAICARGVELAGVSQAVAADLRRSGARIVHVLPNVLDLVALDARALTRAEARRLLRIDPHEVALGIVGRLHAKKHPAAPVLALHGVHSRLGRRLRLHYVGDGPMRAELTALAARLGIVDSVRFHGAIPDAARLMPAFDALLACPGPREAFGMVVLEAMAARVPVLCADAPASREVLGSTGRFFTLGMESSLGEALVDFAELPAAELNRWGSNGRARAETCFSVTALAARYRELLRL